MHAIDLRKSAEIRSRIEPDLKKESVEVLAGLGLDMSDAIRLFLRKVVEVQGLPFSVRRPNAKTIAAMNETRSIKTARFSSEKELYEAFESKKGGEKARRLVKKV